MTYFAPRTNERSPISSKSVAILDRILEQQAPSWTEEEAAGIMNLEIVESRDSSLDAETRQTLLEQYAVCLELVKCRARLESRAKHRKT